ncbi:electron transfer flavoprotein alpha subunit apoprotein [Epilithonimonas bovis DSM 19482]|jgi:electron transfer flavoprotein alpha subunit|uniref:Electron transfer flavoprotein alpha subunit apoprotein n=1 Tax=Epilithonimonas bovis DSM 19482 TaxID=1121284 RepID=A0A1U7PXA7_9FLAO|nr:electron transfer flavoprotein subunit alpha/FixB family protein [Epilithonimonas bovis]MDN5627671.1 electron transfer flavoprotein subunit alpha/FixB family protein [Weeksellaceae bacterium]QIY82344.1 electron transfer flavoprotein subunit alpha/FixB family protein [Chryseobacterium sp. NEB161]SIT96408.1 electron transfer flavoprotein alpha subunit apoprotein [Epilithonimonas bovis DSM 19482]
MAVFVYAENINGVYKKAAFEAVSYAKAIAAKTGDSVTAISINPTDSSDLLYKYGADKVINVKDAGLKNFSAKAYAEAVNQVVDGNIIVFPHTTDASSVAPMLAIQKNFSLITNAIDLPESTSPFQVKRRAFSGKGFMHAKADAAGVIVTVSQNAFGVKENPVQGSEEVKDLSVANDDTKVISHEQSSGKLDLKEAEIVVSAGRGLKGPENWGMIEDLANVLGAATACSKPVSDIGWRPHTEHVGQTGKAISPNLYIAVGISGAIQHLAGVNSSKTIVVINNDPEAPFFKSADYGVVGDAFQIIPALTEKIKALKGA